MKEEILKIRTWAEDIAGNWNGDLPGRDEDRAGQALEIMEHCDALTQLIEGMEQL